jgi:hypothetical protein
MRTAGRVMASILVVVFMALSGCAGPAVKTVADWHDAVLAVREQSGTAFRGVNELVREAQIRRAATLTNLKESDFQPGLDAASLAAWNRALDSLAAYSAALSTLLSPDLPAGVGDSTKRLAESIANTSKAKVGDTQRGLFSAIGRLGTKLASVAAARDAATVMRETDPQVHDVLNEMAKMIYDDTKGMETGILLTVRANWTEQSAALAPSFLDAKSPAEKQEIARRYAALLAQREASDTAFLSLRRSLLELAAAHSRAAAGGSMDTSAVIADIRDQTAFLRALLADLKPATR